MADAYGACPLCGEWGALWKVPKAVRKYWLFGPLVTATVYRCDECCCRRKGK